MSVLVLDSEAFSRIARTHDLVDLGSVHAALTAAAETGSDVVVPAAVLAEQYRGGGHDQTVDACLGRHTGIDVVDTTRQLARTIGKVLARANRGSEHHVDATVVATAIAAGGGVIVTGDLDDIDALCDGLVGITIETI